MKGVALKIKTTGNSFGGLKSPWNLTGGQGMKQRKLKQKLLSSIPIA